MFCLGSSQPSGEDEAGAVLGLTLRWRRGPRYSRRAGVAIPAVARARMIVIGAMHYDVDEESGLIEPAPLPSTYSMSPMSTWSRGWLLTAVKAG